MKAGNAVGAKGVGQAGCIRSQTGNRRKLLSATKPFIIPEQLVMDAFEATGIGQISRKGSPISLCTGSGGWLARLLDGSGVRREAHAPFCERLGVRFPRPTHHEQCNVQKNHGYELTHNSGHGQQTLSMVFYFLNLLAFMAHMILDRGGRLYQRC